jgi:uncharacterized membrane protein
MAFCSGCGTQIPDGSTMCPACSAKVPAGRGAQGTTGGMTDNVAGMLAYLLIPAIIFLVQEPYNKNRFVRFHSFQAIFYCAAAFVLGIALSILSGIFTAILPLLIFITVPLHLAVGLGLFILWIVLLLKANQGQMFKLPVIGDLAEKQANAS